MHENATPASDHGRHQKPNHGNDDDPLSTTPHEGTTSATGVEKNRNHGITAGNINANNVSHTDEDDSTSINAGTVNDINADEDDLTCDNDNAQAGMSIAKVSHIGSLTFINNYYNYYGPAKDGENNARGGGDAGEDRGKPPAVHDATDSVSTPSWLVGLSYLLADATHMLMSNPFTALLQELTDANGFPIPALHRDSPYHHLIVTPSRESLSNGFITLEDDHIPFQITALGDAIMADNLVPDVGNLPVPCETHMQREITSDSRDIYTSYITYTPQSEWYETLWESPALVCVAAGSPANGRNGCTITLMATTRITSVTQLSLGIKVRFKPLQRIPLKHPLPISDHIIDADFLEDGPTWLIRNGNLRKELKKVGCGMPRQRRRIGRKH